MGCDYTSSTHRCNPEFTEEICSFPPLNPSQLHGAIVLPVPPDWQPTGYGTRPPMLVRGLSQTEACDVAQGLNALALHECRPVWHVTFAIRRNLHWGIIRVNVPENWNPGSLWDLPPQVRCFAHSRRWVREANEYAFNELFRGPVTHWCAVVHAARVPDPRPDDVQAGIEFPRPAADPGWGRSPYFAERRQLWLERPHCRYCGKRVSFKHSTVDHVVPRFRGGRDEPQNLVLACEACNVTKGCRTPAEWARDILNGAQAEGKGVSHVA